MSSLKNHLPDIPPRTDLPHAPASQCPDCGDTGYVAIEGARGSYLKPCKCLMKKIKQNRFGENYREKTIENFEPRSLTGKHVKRILTNTPEASYLISGNVGLGKTHLLAGLFEKLWDKYGTMMFFRKELDLLEWLKTEKHWMLDLQDNAIRVVQIDDLGKISLASWDVERFFRFYDFISSNRIILQITTNLTPEEIAGSYGAAITDRLFRNNKCEILSLKTSEAETEPKEGENE